MATVRIKNLVKRFGSITAVDGIDLLVEEDEFITLLGPSGCGKTTTLRCVAGFEEPDSGEITIGNMVVSSPSKGVLVAPEKRGLGMVFQSYAIWPHMTVFNNAAYGLQAKKMPKKEIQEKVENALAMVGLQDLGHRYATQLSGGQQQRVALARSIAAEPQVLLLDEPLSNLDAKLRERMRFELKELQRKTRITSIYVTHDQAEAMVMSDRIVVMNEGRIQQIGTARDLYQRPANRFVADFIGLTNVFVGKVIRANGRDLGEVRIDPGIAVVCPIPNSFRPGDEVAISIRPENMKLHTENPPDGRNIWQGKVKRGVYLGNLADYQVSIGEREIRIQTDASMEIADGANVFVQVDPKECLVMKD
ncbi:MAG: ABC transporter ATP-binding protein [Candidatus Binatia bacterium]